MQILSQNSCNFTFSHLKFLEIDFCFCFFKLFNAKDFNKYRVIQILLFKFCRNVGNISGNLFQRLKYVRVRLQKVLCVPNFPFRLSHCFIFPKSSIISSSISTPHLDFHEVFYIFKNSKNLVIILTFVQRLDYLTSGNNITFISFFS